MNMDHDQELSFNQEFTPVVQRNIPVPVLSNKADFEQHWWLVDEHSKKEYSLQTLPCVIGRSRDCTVPIRGKSVSRQHARILKENGALLIRDLGSTNGIRVNRKQYVECRLFDGDIIGIGDDYEFVLQSRPAPVKSFSAPGLSIDVESSSSRDASRSTGLQVPPYRRGRSTDTADDEAVVFQVEDERSPLSDMLRWVVFVLVLVAAGLIAHYVFTDNSPTLYPSPRITSQIPPAESKEDDSVAFVVHPSVSSLEALSSPPKPIPPPSSERPSSLITGNVPRAGGQKDSAQSSKASNVPTKKTPTVQASQEKRAKLQEKIETNYLAGNVSDAIVLLDQAARSDDYTMEDKKDLSALKKRYRSLLDQYLEGERLFKAGQKANAFKIWSAFVKAEKEIFGTRKSQYALKVGRNVTGSLMDSATVAAKNRQFHKAWRLWDKAKMIGVDDRGQVAMQEHEEKVVRLYDEAIHLEKTDPDRAVVLLQEVEKLIPPGTEYNAKASGKIDLMKNWNGGRLNE